jgi:hypothetical protein
MRFSPRSRTSSAPTRRSPRTDLSSRARAHGVPRRLRNALLAARRRPGRHGALHAGSVVLRAQWLHRVHRRRAAGHPHGRARRHASPRRDSRPQLRHDHHRSQHGRAGTRDRFGTRQAHREARARRHRMAAPVEARRESRSIRRGPGRCRSRDCVAGVPPVHRRREECRRPALRQRLLSRRSRARPRHSAARAWLLAGP